MTKAMRQVPIQRMHLDANGRLRLQPDELPDGGYEWIYRDASSVRWDADKQELYMLEVPGFTPEREFNQIISAVQREYGQNLLLTDSTVFAGIPALIVAAIRSLTNE